MAGKTTGVLDQRKKREPRSSDVWLECAGGCGWSAAMGAHEAPRVGAWTCSSCVPLVAAQRRRQGS